MFFYEAAALLHHAKYEEPGILNQIKRETLIPILSYIIQSGTHQGHVIFTNNYKKIYILNGNITTYLIVNPF
jgi:hypothetical protein